MINVIRTNKSMVKDFPITKDTLIYTLDTRETFFDLDHTERMQIRTGVQYRNEAQIFAIDDPKTNKLYISISSNKIYRRNNNSFEEIKNRNQLVDLLIPMKEMIPVVLREGQDNIAPRTLMTQVFTEDGRNLEEVLEDRSKDQQTFILIKSNVLEAETDRQKVFDIPFPIANYDVTKFPIEVIFGRSEYVKPSNYTITKNQLIFGDVFAERIRKGNLITLIFHYSDTVVHSDKINANLINGRYVSYSETEPLDSKLGDIWYNLAEQTALVRTETGWKDILNPENIDILKNNIVISAQEMDIPIGIESFNKLTDGLEVYRNGLLYVPEMDYTVSEDNSKITLTEPNAFYIEGEMHTFQFVVTKNGLPKVKNASSDETSISPTPSPTTETDTTEEDTN